MSDFFDSVKTETIKGVEIDNFTHHYITAALWSETDNSRDDGGDPLDENYTINDLSEDCLRKMKEECDTFRAYEGVAELLEKAYEMKTDYTEGYAGHDFWFTRNLHGVGFWDRDLNEVGDRLTEICQQFGEVNLYVGDDGLIYHYP